MLLLYAYFSQWFGETCEMLSGRPREEGWKPGRSGDSCGRSSETLQFAKGIAIAPTAIAPSHRLGMSNISQPIAPTETYPIETLKPNAKPGEFCVEFWEIVDGVEHRHLFFYTESTRVELMKYLGELAADPSHPINWHDVAEMTKMMRSMQLELDWYREAE